MAKDKKLKTNIRKAGIYSFRHSELAINALIGNDKNPLSRSKADTEQFNTLKSAIEENDNTIFQDILVAELESGEFEVIDGHRRLAVAKTLKLPTVPCKIITANSEDDVPCEKLFKDLNKSQFKISGVQFTEMYLNGGLSLIPKQIIKHHQELEQYGGENIIQTLVDKGIAGSTVARTVTSVCNECNKETVEEKKQIVDYILEKGKHTLIRDKKTHNVTAERLWEIIVNLQDFPNP